MNTSPAASTPVGTPVHVDYRKWVDAPSGERAEHWQEPCQFLGIDEYGVWLGMPAGTVAAKPTFSFAHTLPHVKLITDRGWSANINEPTEDPHRITIYVDMVSEPEWQREGDGFRVTMIDLDLDVLQRVDHSIEIDDEDEFAEHRVSARYPDAAVALAESACAEVHTLLTEKKEPFRTVGQQWLKRAAALTLRG